MRKFASVAVIPLFAGFLWAAAQSQTRTTTTTTTFNGTLVDAGCYTTEHKETTSSTRPDESRTSTTTSTKVECPVTTTTTTFGLVSPEGRYVRFDEPSNTKIIEVVKSNREWKREMEERKPIKVRVSGKHSGEVVVIESIK